MVTKVCFFYVITKFQTVFLSFFPNVLCVCCHFSILFPWCKTHKSVLLVVRILFADTMKCLRLQHIKTV